MTCKAQMVRFDNAHWCHQCGTLATLGNTGVDWRVPYWPKETLAERLSKPVEAKP